MLRKSVSALFAVAFLFAATEPSYADRPCKNGHKPPCGGWVKGPVIIPPPKPCRNCASTPRHPPKGAVR
jgi:hypothetical protein